MITASSGVAEARLVLDAMDAPDGWDSWPLLVGDELVGTLLLLPSHPGGLEVRQDRVCRQLLPTIARVARAVVLAVDAGYARTMPLTNASSNARVSWPTSMTTWGRCWPG